MPIRSTLLSEIQSAIGAAVSPGLTSRSAAFEIYEAYIFSLILNAARIEGAQIRFEARSGLSPSVLVFRSKPGYIHSTRHDYTHAVIEFDNAPALEVHVSVRVSPASKVLHECDISVIDRNEAITCRANEAAPRNSKVLLAVECKFYGSGLPLDIGRSFMGLTKELSGKNRYLVFNTGAPSVEKMLGHYNYHWEHNIVPSFSTNVERLRNGVQTAFKNYKAISLQIK